MPSLEAPLDQHPEAQPTDGELVAGTLAGQRSAFETLVRRHQKSLYFVCYRHVLDHDAAADLAQRAFIRAMNNLQGLRKADSFRSWLLTIGTRLSLNHLRDAARTVNQDIPECAVVPEANRLLEAVEQSRALQAAVSTLPNRQRAVMQLRIYEELPFNDIARVLSTTANAAKVNFHMAVKNLQRQLVRPSAHGAR